MATTDLDISIDITIENEIEEKNKSVYKDEDDDEDFVLRLSDGEEEMDLISEHSASSLFPYRVLHTIEEENEILEEDEVSEEDIIPESLLYSPFLEKDYEELLMDVYPDQEEIAAALEPKVKSNKDITDNQLPAALLQLVKKKQIQSEIENDNNKKVVEKSSDSSNKKLNEVFKNKSKRSKKRVRNERGQFVKTKSNDDAKEENPEEKIDMRKLMNDLKYGVRVVMKRMADMNVS